jgi:CheY-like chemotaxis protein
MADGQQLAVDETFSQALRSALQYLYDWEALRRSPLVTVFGLTQQHDAPVALSRILTAAIEELRPNSDVPLRAKAWRQYRLLYSRYTEQLSQTETASDMGLSVRHLRRMETEAIDSLASHLWHHQELAPKWHEARQWLAPKASLDRGFPDPDQTPSYYQELSWLKESLTSEAVEVADIVGPVLELLRPLAESGHTSLRYAPSSVPPVVVLRTPIRQALLIVAQAVVRAVRDGAVTISTRAENSEVLIHIEATSPKAACAAEAQEEALEPARQLVELSQGSLTLLPSSALGQRFSADIALPAQDCVPVLLIDDNADTLQLLERYLANTRYRFVAALNAEQAVELAEAEKPQVIVLDLMLPTVDGWELLGRLRQRSCTHGVPILVCSILPMARLAVALGATSFLQKPVSRERFLAALDQHLELDRPESGSVQ